MIAEDCQHIDYIEEDDVYWCSYYQTDIGNCGHGNMDCPAYLSLRR